MGVLAFLGLATVVAIVCHRWVRPFWLALLISGPLAASLVQVAVTVQLGRRDPLWLIAVFTTTLFGWAVSLLVGLVMRFVPFDPVPKDGGSVNAQPRSKAEGKACQTDR
jgi:hypothetical protein